MTYTILFVVALICVSGFIAYFGDVLGRRMGKKRLTLFNLRPRHTAIVVTTITGMIISTLALVTLFSVNSQFRKVLLRGEQILSQNKQLSLANAGLEKRGKQLKFQVAKQRRELVDAQQDAVHAKKQRDIAQKQVARLQREIATRQQELADLRKQKNVVQGELDLRMADLNLARVELRNAQTSLTNAQSQLAAAQQKLGATEAALLTAEEKLKFVLGKLEQTTDMSGAATDYVYRMRVNELVFQEGDELARGLIKPAQSDFAVKADILSLLSRASEKVLADHARVGGNGRAVILMYWPAPDKVRVEPNDDERECIDIIAKKIAMSGGSDVMVQVVCGMNTLADAQVPVEMRLFVNQRIYKTGEKIASISVDGRESDGAVLLALNKFLRTDVATTAVRAGLVPASGKDTSALLGQAQADQLLQAVAKVKSMKAVADVSVYATGDIYTQDSLNLSNIRLAVE